MEGCSTKVWEKKWRLENGSNMGPLKVLYSMFIHYVWLWSECPVFFLFPPPFRENLSVQGVPWFCRYVMINFLLLFLLTFLTTPTIIINTIDKFNVTKPLYTLNVRLWRCRLSAWICSQRFENTHFCFFVVSFSCRALLSVSSSPLCCCGPSLRCCPL